MLPDDGRKPLILHCLTMAGTIRTISGITLGGAAILGFFYYGLKPLSRGLTFDFLPEIMFRLILAFAVAAMGSAMLPSIARIPRVSVVWVWLTPTHRPRRTDPFHSLHCWPGLSSQECGGWLEITPSDHCLPSSGRIGFQL